MLIPLKMYRLWFKIPDPLLGPKGVRMLLAFRGFSGYAIEYDDVLVRLFEYYTAFWGCSGSTSH